MLTLIDTHIAVALYQGKVSGLSAQARRAIDRDDLRYSPASVLELELLHEIGRLRRGALAVISYLQTELEITVADTPMAQVCSEALVLSFTRDPFDRLIVAHAQLLNAPLITHDERIRGHYRRCI